MSTKARLLVQHLIGNINGGPSPAVLVSFTGKTVPIRYISFALDGSPSFLLKQHWT
jgi:hypothetical protein